MNIFLIGRPRAELEQWCCANISALREEYNDHRPLYRNWEINETSTYCYVTIYDDRYAALFRLAFGGEAKVVGPVSLSRS